MTVSRSVAATRWPQQQVRDYAVAARISETAARRALAVQRQVPDIQRVLDDTLGDALTQAHFDAKRGEYVLLVDQREMKDRPVLTDDLRSTLGRVELADAYRLVPVAFSRADFDALYAALQADLAPYVSKGAVMLAERADATAEVTITTPSEELADAIQKQVAITRSSSKVPVSIKLDPDQSALPTVACRFPNCDTIVGGVQWGWTSQSAFSCQQAWYVGSPGTPNPLMLTAGHCTIGHDWQSAQVWNPDGSAATIGHQIPFYYFDGGGDGGLLEVTSGRPIQGGYVSWANNGYSALTSYFPDPAMIGYIACVHSGRNIGYNQGGGCGYINSHSVEANYGATANSPAMVVSGLIGVDNSIGMCTKQGDSGSAIAWANSAAAIGIASGASGDGVNAWDPYNTYCPSQTYVEPVGRALSRLGVVIYGG